MRISDWSSDVCSSDLTLAGVCRRPGGSALRGRVSFDPLPALLRRHRVPLLAQFAAVFLRHAAHLVEQRACLFPLFGVHVPPALHAAVRSLALFRGHVLPALRVRSEEHTSELQSLMRISYAVFCLKKKNKT